MDKRKLKAYKHYLKIKKIIKEAFKETQKKHERNNKP